MGQQIVYDFLKGNKGKWFTTKELAKKTGSSIGSVTNSAKKLRYREEVYYKTDPSLNNGRDCYLYKYKK